MSAEKKLDRYGRWIPSGVSARTVDHAELPVIDFAPMFGSDPEAKKQMAQELKQACMGVGFFHLANHGVPQSLIDRTFARTAEFFALPLADKMTADATQAPGYPGFYPMKEAVGGVARAMQEGFNMNFALPPDDPHMVKGLPLHDRNLWPEKPAGFREDMEAYFDAMRALSRRMFGAFALALDLPEDYFDALTTKPITLMRVNHYAAQPDAVDDEQIGGKPHTDFECFTILAQQKDIVALQVATGAGYDEWISVPPIPGTFVVNIGDQMTRWTNDMFASTMHRVVNSNKVDRTSIAFFAGTDYDAEMAVLPTCVPAGEAPKYAPIKSGEYVLGRVNNAYEGALAKKTA